MPWPRLRPSGDRAVLVEFENRIDPQVNRSVRSLALAIESDRFPGEVLPAYRSLMVTYDPLQVDYQDLLGKMEIWIDRARNIELPPGRFFRLPTLYGGLRGPDLIRVADAARLSPEEVIRIFSETHFLVYFVGFICGLPYLGGLPEEFQVPRLANPRTVVPAGSVGLAAGQANLVPTDQPSGFNYIGRTLIKLYDPQAFPPNPFIAGDQIQFVNVSAEEARKGQGRWATDFL